MEASASHSSWDEPLTYVCEQEYKELTASQFILIYAGMALGGIKLVHFPKFFDSMESCN
ncbi:unnamed protein product [Prunus armeniaca]|uniref:Uncharacterized protein n=1 Tax=Prunus armeniaca TaxID=36596 RepID=A0A6J5TM01_PRUAR|nr:unnamed protein product [Prunus armeniaca]